MNFPRNTSIIERKRREVDPERLSGPKDPDRTNGGKDVFQREWRREGLTSSPFHSPGEQSSALETATDSGDWTAWSDFAHVPYEPVRIDRSHDVILMPIDPYRIWAGMQIRYDDTRPGGISGALITDPVLRVLDVTHAALGGSRTPEDGPDYWFDIHFGTAPSWYIPLWSSHRYVMAQLGWFHGDRFVVLARSNMIRTPSGRARSTVGRFFRRDRSGHVSPAVPPYPYGYFDELERLGRGVNGAYGSAPSSLGRGIQSIPGSIPSSFGRSRG